MRRALSVAVACCRRWARAAGVRQSRGVICKRRRRATCPSASCIRRTKWSCCWTRSASWSPPAVAERTYRYPNLLSGMHSPNCVVHTLTYQQGIYYLEVNGQSIIYTLSILLFPSDMGKRRCKCRKIHQKILKYNFVQLCCFYFAHYYKTTCTQIVFIVANTIY